MRVWSSSDGLELVWIFAGHPPPQISVYQSYHYWYTKLFPYVSHAPFEFSAEKEGPGWILHSSPKWRSTSTSHYSFIGVSFESRPMWSRPSISSVTLFLTLSWRWGTRVKLAWILGCQYLLFQFSLLLGVWKCKAACCLNQVNGFYLEFHDRGALALDCWNSLSFFLLQVAREGMFSFCGLTAW